MFLRTYLDHNKQNFDILRNCWVTEMRGKSGLCFSNDIKGQRREKCKRRWRIRCGICILVKWFSFLWQWYSLIKLGLSSEILLSPQVADFFFFFFYISVLLQMQLATTFSWLLCSFPRETVLYDIWTCCPLTPAVEITVGKTLHLLVCINVSIST